MTQAPALRHCGAGRASGKHKKLAAADADKVCIDGTPLVNVPSFKCLGSFQEQDATTDQAIRMRLAFQVQPDVPHLDRREPLHELQGPHAQGKHRHDRQAR